MKEKRHSYRGFPVEIIAYLTESYNCENKGIAEFDDGSSIEEQLEDWFGEPDPESEIKISERLRERFEERTSVTLFYEYNDDNDPIESQFRCYKDYFGNPIIEPDVEYRNIDARSGEYIRCWLISNFGFDYKD